jgi:hypothetical protein
LNPDEIEHAREQIDKGKRGQDVAALLNVHRTTLYRRLRVDDFRLPVGHSGVTLI